MWTLAHPEVRQKCSSSCTGQETERIKWRCIGNSFFLSLGDPRVIHIEVGRRKNEYLRSKHVRRIVGVARLHEAVSDLHHAEK